jgi:hypothetical protein
MMNARRKRITRVALALAIAGAATFAGVGVADAAERPNVLSCGWDQSLVGPHEYFAFINEVNGQSLPDCFANAGPTAFEPPEIAWRMTSGNNAGSLSFICPGDDLPHLLYFDKWQEYWFCGGASAAKIGSLLIN